MKCLKKLNTYKVVEVYLMGVAFWWAFCLLLPHKTFEMKIYGGMAYFFPEYVWGLYALGLGLMHCLSILDKLRSLLPITLSLSFFFWAFIGLQFLFNELPTNTLSTGSGMYLLIACLTMWLSLNVGGGRGES